MPDSAKRTRRTRAELRDLMIEAGKEVLMAIEPSLGYEQLSYASVFAYLQNEHGIKVTTGSVHERIWNSQRDFQLDVLADVIRDTPEQTFDISRSGAMEALAAADLASPAGRRYSSQNVTRLIQNRSAAAAPTRGDHATRHEAIAQIARFRLWELGEGHAEAPAIADLVHAHRSSSADLYADMIRMLMDTIGLRFRPGFGSQAVMILTALGNAVTVGLDTDPLDAAHEIQLLPTGPAGELEEWHPSAIGLWAIVTHMVELDDDSLSEVERRL